ncbi:MAG: hypothetical protein ACOCP4_02970 [Candidatus Woesearchaeota archaeon]
MAYQKQISLSGESEDLIQKRRREIGKLNFSNFVEWAVRNHLEDYITEKQKEEV